MLSVTRTCSASRTTIRCTNRAASRVARQSRTNIITPRKPDRTVIANGLGDNALGGWLDLTKLVTGGATGNRTAYEDLAYSIGRDVYVDLSGWHLYLRDMNAAPGFKMSQVLAQQLGSQVAGGSRVSERDVEDLLRKVPVQLGGGKLKVSLYEVMPSMCVGDLTRLVEEHARR